MTGPVDAARTSSVPDASGSVPPLSIGAALSARIATGGKCLVPYITAGLGQWQRVAEAVAGAGADAMEIGIPFSDPVMDGPVIQEASDKALHSGMTPPLALNEISRMDMGIPLAVMTYYNLVFRHGDARFAADLVASGVSGVILPDLPLEEVGPWKTAADPLGVETILLAAPTADDARLSRICEASQGFCYAVGLLGVTGVRDELAGSALTIAKRLKNLTDKPVLIGVGIGSPEQAAQACEVADGVVVGSRIVSEMLATDSPEAVADLVMSFRAALENG